jgi:hypothetical protein
MPFYQLPYNRRISQHQINLQPIIPAVFVALPTLSEPFLMLTFALLAGYEPKLFDKKITLRKAGLSRIRKKLVHYLQA